MKISKLKAGKLNHKVTGKVMEALVEICASSSFNGSSVGDTWKENGVFVLRPQDIANDEMGAESLNLISLLLGLGSEALHSYYFLEIWDDR